MVITNNFFTRSALELAPGVGHANSSMAINWFVPEVVIVMPGGKAKHGRTLSYTSVSPKRNQFEHTVSSSYIYRTGYWPASFACSSGPSPVLLFVTP